MPRGIRSSRSRRRIIATTVSAIAIVVAGIGPARYAESRTSRATSGAHPSAALLHFFGGGVQEFTPRIAISSNGDVYIAGSTISKDWPVRWHGSCVQNISAANCSAGFVIRLNPKSGKIRYSAVIDQAASATGLVVDGAGNAYVAGVTDSPHFPVIRGFSLGKSSKHVYVARINPIGKIDYTALIGGNAGDDYDLVGGMALAPDGSIVLTGSTSSTSWARINAEQPRPGGGEVGSYDAFVVKIPPMGRAPIYSTYFGGRGDDEANAVAVDRWGQAYITGSTNSNNLPVAHALQPKFIGGTCDTPSVCRDVFVAELGIKGKLVRSTYLGTPRDESGGAIVLSPQGTVVVGGWTDNLKFPSTQDAPPNDKSLCGVDLDYSACHNAFVESLPPTMDRIVSSTILHGDGGDDVNSLAIGAHGKVVIGGYTTSTSFPTVNPTQGRTGGGQCLVGRKGDSTEPCDGFVAVLSPDGHTVTFNTFIGGSSQDDVQSVAIGPGATVYAVGTFHSPELHALDGSKGDVFLARFTGVL